MAITEIDYDFEKIFSAEVISRELQNGGLFLLVWEGFKELVDNAMNFYYHGSRVGLTDAGKPQFYQYKSISMMDFISKEYKLEKNQRKLECERDIAKIQKDNKCDFFMAQCLWMNEFALTKKPKSIFSDSDISKIESLNKSRRYIAHEMEIFLKHKNVTVSYQNIGDVMDLIYKANKWYHGPYGDGLYYDLHPSKHMSGIKITQETVFLEHILSTLNFSEQL